MIVLSPNSPWFHLFSLFFTLSAFFEKDILLIRICLVCAYVGIVANSATGFPNWPNFYTNPPRISIDAVIWGLIPFIVHIRGLIILLRAQRNVKFSKEEEPIARFLYRRAGMKKWEAEEAIRKGQFVRVKAGDEIRTDRTSLCLVIEGIASFRTILRGAQSEEGLSRSGDLLDFAVLNIVGIRVGFMDVDFEARAKTDCLLFRWPFENLAAMTTGEWPALCQGWQNLALYSIASEFNRRSHIGIPDLPQLDSNGEPENDKWLEGGRSRDFGEWTQLENPPPPASFAVRICHSIGTTLTWIANSFTCTPIKNLRHVGPVMSGLGAREQLLALGELSEQTGGSKKTIEISGWFGKMESLGGMSHKLLQTGTSSALALEQPDSHDRAFAS
eukprot:comp17690_c0_seq1/m.17554 comp17690_c0_seq1/g.17554  ORF comp17690_c0_seq1/g.17554 comp17690_c0_seq1/m.17554 type:complete len:387 (-) comp17690_c0_seq1:701-1861(-)